MSTTTNTQQQSFADELRACAPGLPQTAVTALESAYGHSTGFCAGLDIFARLWDKNAILPQIPAFSEPWKSLYSDILSEIQNKGKTFRDALYGVLMTATRPAWFELHNAIIVRKDEIDRIGKNTHGKSLTDYQAELLMLGYDLRLNLCGMHIEVNGHSVTDYDDSEIRMQMEDNGFKIRQRITDAIMITAKQNEYHPIKDYLNGLKWDGISRIQQLAQYFTLKDELQKEPKYVSLFSSMLRKWLIGAIARIMDGDQNPMLVLEGPQGIGKSTFAKWLCPDPKYHKESGIDPDNKDHRIATSEVWIWEVGELGSTTKKADREALKSFLTTKTFTERAAYGKYNQPYRAMASFIGTVNDENGFLNDPTGSRRFWTIGIKSIDYKYADALSIDDIWAEAMHAYKNGESHDLDLVQKQRVDELAEDYRMVNSTEEAIKKYFDITGNQNDFLDFNTIRSVLVDPNQGNLNARDASDVKIASALKALGLERTRQYISQQALGHNKLIQVRGYIGIKTI